MTYQRINTITGWAVFAVALLVYLLTMAPTASFWDCGEFIACANELEVPHPPGAPFFLLVGRIFAMLAPDVTQVAWMLNFMSVLASAFTVLFTFWITTHLARRLLAGGETEKPQLPQTLAIMAAGVVAGLTCTFSDSFWFNAVEAEVYAMSSFFTAVVVWLMFKWEARADEPGNARWLILIAYLMGLSIGVHLLNLLTVPALAFIYYFRKHKFSLLGFTITGLVSVLILAVVQTGIILYSFDIAWALERLLTGTELPGGLRKTGMGLPPGTGTTLFFLLLFSAIAFLIWFSQRRKMVLLNLLSMGGLVIYLGFASYLMIPIRSNANPPIDENNPDNAQTFLSYMKREQYGDRPLFFGPLYNAQPVRIQNAGKDYILEPNGERYTILGEKREYEFADKDKKLFPRMYYAERYNAGPHGYVNYVANKGRDKASPYDDKPTASEDLWFFLSYQLNHMYWRYFFWNFVGRQGDLQDMAWESGLNVSKNAKMPDFIREDAGKNHFFYLPLLLGLAGIIWQSTRRGNDAAIMGLLFFFTGIAIIIYLNQYPAQPRERDYSFAGSFQTFAIWVGLGVIALYELLRKYLKGAAAYVATTVGLAAPALMAAQGWDDHSRANNYLAPDSAYNLLNSLAPNAVLFTNGDNDTFPLWYLQEVEGVRTDVRVLCLSYVNTDWYIEQMKQQVNQSEPLPLTLERKNYTGQKNQSKEFGGRDSLSFTLPVDTAYLYESGVIRPEDRSYVQAPMRWKFATRGSRENHYLFLKDLLLIDLIETVAKQGWRRPVYFANTVTQDNFLDLEPYFRQEGLAYRVLPLRKPQVPDMYDQTIGHMDLDLTYQHLLKDFRYRNLDRADVYYDENAFRMLYNYHNTFYRLARTCANRMEELERENNALRAQALSGVTESMIAANVREIDSLKARAKEVMLFAEEKLPTRTLPPDPFLIIRSGIMYDRIGLPEQAVAAFDYGKERALSALSYYDETGDYFNRFREYQISLQLLQQHYIEKGERDKATEIGAEIARFTPRR
jgi:hypothetical protein